MIILIHKNAFQWDAYRPLVDRIPACTAHVEGVCPGGVYLPGGTYPREVYLPGGVPGPGGGGVPAQGGVYLPGGVPGLGEGVYLARGVSALGVYMPVGVPARGCIPACNGADTLPPPVDRQTPVKT